MVLKADGNSLRWCRYQWAVIVYSHRLNEKSAKNPRVWTQWAEALLIFDKSAYQGWWINFYDKNVVVRYSCSVDPVDIRPPPSSPRAITNTVRIRHASRLKGFKELRFFLFNAIIVINSCSVFFIPSTGHYQDSMRFQANCKHQQVIKFLLHYEYGTRTMQDLNWTDTRTYNQLSQQFWRMCT